MTRFDAADPAARQKLFAAGVTAHRERASAFVTFEAHRDASAMGDDPASDKNANDDDSASDESTSEATDAERTPPWVQFGDGTLNLDCTEAELDRLKDVLADFPAFKIDELTRPEEAEGVNVRVSALADTNRVAQCVERLFREVYDQPESFRAWVAAV